MGWIGLDLRVLTLDAESDGTMGLRLGLAVGGAETVEMSSGSLTALVESDVSAAAKSFRIVTGEVPLMVSNEGDELARDEKVDAVGGGTEVAVTGG